MAHRTSSFAGSVSSAPPYGYDWIDNLGQRSPRELTRGLEKLEPGQPVMTIFELATHPIWGRATRALLPLGDMVMMRRQLLNLKSLAEATTELAAARASA